MPGRPRKLSESKQNEVCALIHAGCTLAAAARYVDCSVLTLQREARRNPDFYEKLRKARYSNELSPIRTLRDAAAHDWRAAAWVLERTQPQHYSKRAANSFSPQEVAELLDRVCDIIRHETRDAQKSARIKRRVLALAHAKVDRPEDNPFRRQLAPPNPVETPAAADLPAASSADPDSNVAAVSDEPNSMPPLSQTDRNATQKKPVLICAADIPLRDSSHFAPAHAS